MKRFLLFAIIVIALFKTSYGQYNYQAANVVITSGTYTDLGTNGTAITTNSSGTSMTYDDDYSSVQNIGFNFVYNGTTFTQFVLNSNGYIKLGNTVPTAQYYYPGPQSSGGDCISSTETNLIYAFNHDLFGATSPEYRVFVSGTAPNRVCTIQYKNVTDYTQTSYTVPQQYSSINFQIKLYETTNNIEFVYGTFTSSGLTATFKTAAVGIKGNDAATSVNLTKASSVAWSSASVITGNYTGNTFNNRNNPLPVSGVIYRFVAVTLPANDAAVSNINTLGKLPLVLGNGHVISATVSNAGSATINNLNVTLNITGANTYTNTKTIASLAVGASTTVSFDGFTANAAGTNNISVSIPNDDVNTNNATTFTQTVVNNGFGYPTTAAASSSVGYNTGSGLILNRHNFTNAASINGVRVFIASRANTVFGVICSASGTILAQSPDYSIQTSDSLTWVNFNFPSTVNITANTDFFIGIGQRAGSYGYFPVGTQTENPTRANIYATAALAGGTPTFSSTLGRFMIEGIIPATTPVIFSSFAGTKQVNNHVLSWTTATEINNAGFELQRSTDGTNFTTIGNIASKAVNGNSNGGLTYEFTDTKPVTGKNYYRLKQNDKDGKFSYSSIVMLELNGKGQFVLNQNYPNPVKGVTQLSYQLNTEGKVTIELFTQDGKKVTTIVNAQQGIGSYNLSVDVNKLGLAAGNYVYRMVVADGSNQTVFQASKTLTVVQ